MRFDFLAADARQALIAAQRLARTRDEDAVELEHLLLGLLTTAPVVALLARAEVDADGLQRGLEQALSGSPKRPGAQVFLGERVLRLLDVAQVEAQERGATTVGPLDLLVGIPLETRSAAAELLRDRGLTLPRLEQLTSSTESPPSPTPPPPPTEITHRPLLAKYARDLIAEARSGKMDPVVGRDNEIRRMVQILGRRGKNNPVLVGDPGVGKTAIVEGLAQRMAEGDVPDSLRGKQLLGLDVGQLVAGAKFRGEFEERIRGLMAEVRDADGEILLFFDELHTLVGAGQGESGLDAAELFKPALARGELTIIGATTPDEYRLHIEKDPAFERRLQPVLVAEPDEDTCLAMLRAVKPRYEERHRVRVLDEALLAAVKLSRRYLAGRALPDKAIDLLDEAASRLRLELDSRPDELDALERKARGLRVQIEALRKERGAEPQALREDRERQLAALSDQLVPLHAKWQAELQIITSLGEAAAALESTRVHAEAAERLGDLSRAAEIRYGKLPALETAVLRAEARLREAQGTEPLLEDSCQGVHVARVVADWTGIPVNRMLEAERQKVLQIEDRLRKRVVGQDEAVKVVGHAIKRARAGLADPGRPIGSFLFLGPTGVGKTELTKALAEFLFDDEHALCRLDMAEYMEKHAVSRLTGAPPGYVGFEDGGQLTEAVRRKPFSVVLFDEVEKAHPDVFNVLLALMDDGRLTDSRGRTVSFSNTVVILTSNLGSPAILAANGDRARIKAEVDSALRGHFRPEFLNRLDEIVIFNPLGTVQIASIVDLQLRRLEKSLAEQNLKLDVSAEARALLAEESYDPAFGARPVKRCVQRRIRDPLAEAILLGTVRPGQVVRVQRVDKTLTFTGT